MKVFIGMETSGMVRRAFAARGHYTISADLLPADDGAQFPQGVLGGHIEDDVFDVLDYLNDRDMWPDLAIFHPTCTYHTVSAAWAFADPDYDRYPGVGYHQRVKPETLVGAARRQARDEAEADVRRIAALPIKRKVIENPRGTLSRILGKATQTIQPYEHGEDASKATDLWLFGDLPLIRPTKYVEPRMVDGRPRWANQTDSGQNRLSPGADRWKPWAAISSSSDRRRRSVSAGVSTGSSIARPAPSMMALTRARRWSGSGSGALLR
jgi:hypothetical protein